MKFNVFNVRLEAHAMQESIEKKIYVKLIGEEILRETKRSIFFYLRKINGPVVAFPERVLVFS